MVLELCVGLTSCVGEWLFGSKLHYPHFLTAFVKPNTFDLKQQFPMNLKEPMYICTIRPFEEGNDCIKHFAYDGHDTTIANFLAAIGDIHFLDRTPYEKHSEKAVGVMIAPKSLVISCDRDYDETLKAGSPLNSVMGLRFPDYLSYIQNGYNSGTEKGDINLQKQDRLKWLLASAPSWHLFLDHCPDSWQGESVQFTITMVFPTESGDRATTRSIEVTFPTASK